MIQDRTQEKSDDTFNLQLVITEQCNLRCRYCFEGRKSSQQMSLELATQVLDLELSNKNSPSKYQIDLVGGEPLLHFDLIKDIANFCKLNAKQWSKRFYFVIGTNLTLLNSEVECWLEENKQWIILSTSLDGTRDAHNHYRCDSYDDVINHLPFYQRLYPLQGVKMTIGPDTICSIYEGIRNIESMGLSVAANVVFEPVWGNLNNKISCLNEFAHQLELLVDHYNLQCNKKLPNMLSLPIENILCKSEENHRWCGSGIRMKAYDTHGRELPCHRFSFFSSNKIFKGITFFGPRVSTKCDQCIYVAACPTCRAYNWQVYNNPDSRTSYHCEFIKMQLLAIAKLVYLRNRNLVESIASGNLSADAPSGLLRSIVAASILLNNLDEDRIISECELGWPTPKQI
jgi:uncharacterized protein